MSRSASGGVLLGAPRAVAVVPYEGLTLVRYRYPARKLAVYFRRFKDRLLVEVLRTTSRSERTRDDIGVGTRETELASRRGDLTCGMVKGIRVCSWGRRGIVTTYTIRSGRVVQVTIRVPNRLLI